MIVAVEYHRACSEDDVVWLESLQLLALLGLGGDARMQREPADRAHRLVERLIARWQSLEGEHLAARLV